MPPRSSRTSRRSSGSGRHERRSAGRSRRRRAGRSALPLGRARRGQDAVREGLRRGSRRDRDVNSPSVHPHGRVRRPPAAVPPRPVSARRRRGCARRRPARRAPAEGVTLVEWAERLGDALPAARLDVGIDGTGDDAAIDHGRGPATRYARYLEAIAPRRPHEPSDGRRRRHPRLDTATTRVVIAVGAPDGGASGASTGRPATAMARRCCRASSRFLGEQNIAPVETGGDRRRDGPGGVHRAAGRDRHGQGPGARPRAADRRDPDRRRRCSRRASPSRPLVRCCSCRPGRPTGSSSGAVHRRAAARRPSSPSSAPGETVVADRPRGRAPGRCARRRGEAARAALGAALLRLGGGAAPAGDVDDLARLVPEYVTLPRGVREPRAGRCRGRATPAEAPHRTDAASPTCRPSTPSRRRASTRHGRPTPTATRSRRTGSRTISSPGSTARSSAFGGMWLMVDEAPHHHVRRPPAWRRQHIGEPAAPGVPGPRLAPRRARGDARGAPLEPARAPAVREVRLPARRAPAPLLQRQRRGRADHDHRPARATRRCASGSAGSAPRSTPRRRPAQLRTSSAQRDRPLGERTARPRRSSRRATRPGSRSSRADRGSWPTSSRRRSRCTRQPEASSPRSRPERMFAGSCRCSTRRGPMRALVGRHRCDRGHVRTRARRLAPRRDQLRQGARVGPRPAAGRGQPPRGPRLRGVAARPATVAEAPEPVFPLVALVVSGGHTFLAEMRDHLTYRLLGATVDDAAGEAFDKVGRLLGLGYPGGPAIGRAAEAATAHDRVFPRAWLGDSFDLSFSGLKTAARRIVDEARRDAGLATRPTSRCPTPWSPSSPGVSRTRSSTSSSRRRSGPRVRRRPVDRPRWRRRREQRPARSARRRGRRARHPADRPAAGALHRQRRDDRGGRRPPVRGRRACRARPRRAPVAAAGGSVRPVTARPPRRRPRERSARRSAPPGLRARHWLSQNFLADADVLDAILAEADPAPGRRVLEIGPGLGLLTGGLLDAGRRGHGGRARPRAGGVPARAVRRRSRTGAAARSRAMRSTRTSPTSSSRRTTSWPTCRTTSRARSSTRCSASRRDRSGWC